MMRVSNSSVQCTKWGYSALLFIVYLSQMVHQFGILLLSMWVGYRLCMLDNLFWATRSLGNQAIRQLCLLLQVTQIKADVVEVIWLEGNIFTCTTLKCFDVLHKLVTGEQAREREVIHKVSISTCGGSPESWVRPYTTCMIKSKGFKYSLQSKYLWPRQFYTSNPKFTLPWILYNPANLDLTYFVTDCDKINKLRRQY